MSRKIKAKCDTCGFSLTAGVAQIGDICPWCKTGTLQTPDSAKDEEKEWMTN